MKTNNAQVLLSRKDVSLTFAVKEQTTLQYSVIIRLLLQDSHMFFSLENIMRLITKICNRLLNLDARAGGQNALK